MAHAAGNTSEFSLSRRVVGVISAPLPTLNVLLEGDADDEQLVDEAFSNLE